MVSLIPPDNSSSIKKPPLLQLLQSEPLPRGEGVKLKSSAEDFRFTIQTFLFFSTLLAAQ